MNSASGFDELGVPGLLEDDEAAGFAEALLGVAPVRVTPEVTGDIAEPGVTSPQGSADPKGSPSEAEMDADAQKRAEILESAMSPIDSVEVLFRDEPTLTLSKRQPFCHVNSDSLSMSRVVPDEEETGTAEVDGGQKDPRGSVDLASETVSSSESGGKQPSKSASRRVSTFLVGRRDFSKNRKKTQPAVHQGRTTQKNRPSTVDSPILASSDLPAIQTYRTSRPGHELTLPETDKPAEEPKGGTLWLPPRNERPEWTGVQWEGEESIGRSSAVGHDREAIPSAVHENGQDDWLNADLSEVDRFGPHATDSLWDETPKDPAKPRRRRPSVASALAMVGILSVGVISWASHSYVTGQANLGRPSNVAIQAPNEVGLGSDGDLAMSPDPAGELPEQGSSSETGQAGAIADVPDTDPPSVDAPRSDPGGGQVRRSTGPLVTPSGVVPAVLTESPSVPRTRRVNSEQDRSYRSYLPDGIAESVGGGGVPFVPALPSPVSRVNVVSPRQSASAPTSIPETTPVVVEDIPEPADLPAPEPVELPAASWYTPPEEPSAPVEAEPSRVEVTKAVRVSESPDQQRVVVSKQVRLRADTKVLAESGDEVVPVVEVAEPVVRLAESDEVVRVARVVPVAGAGDEAVSVAEPGDEPETEPVVGLSESGDEPGAVPVVEAVSVVEVAESGDEPGAVPVVEAVPVSESGDEAVPVVEVAESGDEPGAVPVVEAVPVSESGDEAVPVVEVAESGAVPAVEAVPVSESGDEPGAVPVVEVAGAGGQAVSAAEGKPGDAWPERPVEETAPEPQVSAESEEVVSIERSVPPATENPVGEVEVETAPEVQPQEAEVGRVFVPS